MAEQLPLMASDHVVQTHPPDLFHDLGKATLRGVRKCPKCGTVNGTRGSRCKNRDCDNVFKVTEIKKQPGPVAVKLHTDPAVQIYSVRTKLNESRGFVQLPIVQDLDGNPAVVDPGIVCSAARCYVESCPRWRNEITDPCHHIRNSVEAIDEAEALPFNESMVASLPIPPEIRQQIYDLSAEKEGPMVQRVCRHVMVVKSYHSNTKPVGYIHFTFFPNRKEEKRFICTCKEAKITKLMMSQVGDHCEYRVQRCVHFYACQCAFASDEALSKEYQFVLEADSQEGASEAASKLAPSNADLRELRMKPSDSGPSGSSRDKQLSVLVKQNNGGAGSSSVGVVVDEEDHESEIITIVQDSISYSPPEAKRFKPDPAVTILQIQNGQVSLGFTHWLNSVTEQLNETMHYQLAGTPDPLVFNIPHLFWECFAHRVSMAGGANCRRLPNSTRAVFRKTSPIGEFITYTWYIKELQHVRSIFDNADVALLVSKYFIRNKDGTFSNSQTPRVQVETVSEKVYLDFEPPTKPFVSRQHEYKTFLKVGNQNGKMYPFTIEWTPDLFPCTKTGELVLKFEFGHMIDGLAPSSGNAEDLLKLD